MRHADRKDALLDLLEQATHALDIVFSSPDTAPHALLPNCFQTILPHHIARAWSEGDMPAKVRQALGYMQPWLEDMQAQLNAGIDCGLELIGLSCITRDVMDHAWAAVRNLLTPGEHAAVVDAVREKTGYDLLASAAAAE